MKIMDQLREAAEAPRRAIQMAGMALFVAVVALVVTLLGALTRGA